jgi:hypothetical protein
VRRPVARAIRYCCQRPATSKEASPSDGRGGDPHRAGHVPPRPVTGPTAGVAGRRRQRKHRLGVGRRKNRLDCRRCRKERKATLRTASGESFGDSAVSETPRMREILTTGALRSPGFLRGGRPRRTTGKADRARTTRPARRSPTTSWHRGSGRTNGGWARRPRREGGAPKENVILSILMPDAEPGV